MPWEQQRGAARRRRGPLCVNAVLNSALGAAPDEAERQIFLEYIDRFTVWHLLLLKAFQDPVACNSSVGEPYEPAYSSNREAFLQAVMPELKGHEPMYQRVWGDLSQAGLLGGGAGGMMTDRGWQSRLTTNLGDRFLKFIADPD